jgi:hypothetical protein
MPNRSGATYYCPACDREGAATNRYNHSNSKMHKRNTERKFPRPDRPVNPFTLKRIISAPTLPHLIYLQKP